ncbi:MAG: hypothetical protein Kow00121_45740 [Elainellaceae cyanobacterium]
MEFPAYIYAIFFIFILQLFIRKMLKKMTEVPVVVEPYTDMPPNANFFDLGAMSLVRAIYSINNSIILLRSFLIPKEGLVDKYDQI